MGVGALLTGVQREGVTIVDTVGCAVDWVRALYASGARNFLFQNVSVENKLKEYWLILSTHMVGD